MRRTLPLLRMCLLVLASNLASHAALPVDRLCETASGTMPFDTNGLQTPPPEVVAKSILVINAITGDSLHEKNADQQRSVASTQKLLTALLVVEAADLDRTVTIDKRDTRVEPSVIGVKPGETYSRRQLLTALLIRSGNDVALALARDHSGTIEAFAEKMNLRAWKIGARNSRFFTPNGLTVDHQYSTARDMAMIARAAYSQPLLRNIMATKKVVWTFNDGRTKTLRTTNRVLRDWPLCNGMKTGYTQASGHCLIASGKAGEREIIAVVLGSDADSIWSDAHSLLAWALADPAIPTQSPTQPQPIASR